MNRISSTSTKFRVLFQISFILIPLVNLLLWMFYDKLPNEISMTLLPHALNLDQININSTTKVLSFFASMLQVTIVLYALRLLINLFKNYERNEIFSLTNVSYYRRLGYSFFIWVICSKLVEMLTSLILTYQNAVGHRMIAVRLEVTDFALLIMGGLIILIAWIMNEGHELKEEQALII